MSEPHGHQEGVTATPSELEHGGAAGHGSLPFTDTEWQTLQASDMAASRAVVTLLLSVFLIGVFIYSIVCLVIMF